jgi:hypothetical protein
MEPMYQLKFIHQNKYHILVENGLLLGMLWLFAIFIYILSLFGLDGKVLHMIHSIFLETIRKEELRFSHSPRGLYLIKITIMNYTLKNIYFNIFYERHLHIYYRKILLDRRRISSHEGINGAIQM